jgi:hypothetical protein
MGDGEATGVLQLGVSVVRENAHVSIIRGPDMHGHPTMIFYVQGEMPVDAEFAVPAALLPEPGRRFDHLDITPPLIPTVPEGPDVVLTHIRATIGPEHLTYIERSSHHHVVTYRPRGIILPAYCSRGFDFQANLSFLDGTHSAAATHLSCPK